MIGVSINSEHTCLHISTRVERLYFNTVTFQAKRLYVNICCLKLSKFSHILSNSTLPVFVSNKYINLREIVQNLPSLDKADGTEPNGTLCEAQSSTFSLNIPLLSAHDSALTARDICLEAHVTIKVSPTTSMWQTQRSSRSVNECDRN